MAEKLKEAILWDADDGQKVRCKLCNFRCHIAPGQTGVCRVRKNIDGVLYSLNYHNVCSAGIDPIEKKPLFHYQPGSRSFSIAAPGCNFQCDFCQNWQISQLPRMQDHLEGQPYTPDAIVAAAIKNRCRSISYTYTEPTVFMELCVECGRLARRMGLGNVFVSNGYMTAEAVDLMQEFVDAINVDLKAFTEDFYRTRCKAALQGVLDTLIYIAQKTDIWLEVTTLVVPGLNDSDDELRAIAAFIAEKLGEHVPWHISRFHPQYKQTGLPPTPIETLTAAYDFGKQAGLRYIYIGNVPGRGHESTICHQCDQLLIERNGYNIDQFNLTNGACPGCGAKPAGKNLDLPKAL
jgi:pyruvate formate lyase activating enzyme